MSLNITRSLGTIFDVVEEEKYVKANFSTAERDTREEGKYNYMSWHARFVGKAFEKAKELQDKDRIMVTSAKLTNRYDKEEHKLYVTLVVFDFEPYVPKSAEPTTEE